MSTLANKIFFILIRFAWLWPWRRPNQKWGQESKSSSSRIRASTQISPWRDLGRSSSGRLSLSHSGSICVRDLPIDTSDTIQSTSPVSQSSASLLGSNADLRSVFVLQCCRRLHLEALSYRLLSYQVSFACPS